MKVKAYKSTVSKPPSPIYTLEDLLLEEGIFEAYGLKENSPHVMYSKEFYIISFYAETDCVLFAFFPEDKTIYVVETEMEEHCKMFNYKKAGPEFEIAILVSNEK